MRQKKKYGDHRHFLRSHSNPFKPIKNLLTMEAGNRTIMLTTNQGKLVQYQQQSDLAINFFRRPQLLATFLDLDVLINYSFTPIPDSMDTYDVCFKKPQPLPRTICLLRGRLKWLSSQLPLPFHHSTSTLIRRKMRANLCSGGGHEGHLILNQPLSARLHQGDRTPPPRLIWSTVVRVGWWYRTRACALEAFPL